MKKPVLEYLISMVGESIKLKECIMADNDEDNKKG
jgi:hypothetical protein